MSLETELLISINRSDFAYSSLLIEKFLVEGRVDTLASFLQSTSHESSDLRIRDHIAHFLSIEPLYCVLAIPSYTLIGIANNADSRKEAIEQMFDYITNLVDANDPVLNQSAIRIDRTASSAYAVLLPDIIHRRIQEIENCEVPVAKQASGKRRYYIRNLINTTYGGFLIRSLNGFSMQPVVGEALWNRIARSLQNLGFDPDSMNVEIPDEEWHLHVSSLEKEMPKAAPILHGISPTNEINALRHLEMAMRGLEEIKWLSTIDIHYFETIRMLRTRQCNRELINLLPHMDAERQEIIVEILVNTRDSATENILHGFLKSKDFAQRAIAARGLSKSNALESLIAVEDPRAANLIDYAELISSTFSVAQRRRKVNSTLMLLAKSKIPVVRKDLVKILVQLQEKETSKLLLQLVSDPCEDVEMEVLSHIKQVPRELAKEILNAAFNSSYERVAVKAYDAAKNLDGL